jgi:hypothetical protein
MWIAEFEDGTVVDSTQMHWTDLKKDKKIVNLAFLKGTEGIKNMDSFYYVEEAVCEIPPSSHYYVEAGIIGGVDISSQTIKEYRLEYRTGALRAFSKPISEFRYSKDILVPGKKS